MKKLILVIVAFLVAIPAGYFGIRLIKDAVEHGPSVIKSGGVSSESRSKSLPKVQTPPSEASSAEADNAVKVLLSRSANAILDSLHTPVIQYVGSISRYTGATEYHYSLIGARASIPSEAEIEYVLRSKDDTSFVAKSKNGSFSNIPPTESGIYTLTAYNTEKNKVSQTVDVSGFGLCRPIQSLTQSELQAIYTKGIWPENRQAFEAKFRRGYKITYEGMNTESEINALPRTHQELFQKFRTGIWSSLVVTSVKYDVLGYVSSFNVNYSK